MQRTVLPISFPEKLLLELQDTKNRLKEGSGTAQLLIQYMDYVDVAKQFIYAEKRSNWELHCHQYSRC